MGNGVGTAQAAGAPAGYGGHGRRAGQLTGRHIGGDRSPAARPRGNVRNAAGGRSPGAAGAPAQLGRGGEAGRGRGRGRPRRDTAPPVYPSGYLASTPPDDADSGRAREGCLSVPARHMGGRRPLGQGAHSASPVPGPDRRRRSRWSQDSGFGVSPTHGDPGSPQRTLSGTPMVSPAQRSRAGPARGGSERSIDTGSNGNGAQGPGRGGSERSGGSERNVIGAAQRVKREGVVRGGSERVLPTGARGNSGARRNGGARANGGAKPAPVRGGSERSVSEGRAGAKLARGGGAVERSVGSGRHGKDAGKNGSERGLGNGRRAKEGQGQAPRHRGTRAAASGAAGAASASALGSAALSDAVSRLGGGAEADPPAAGATPGTAYLGGARVRPARGRKGGQALSPLPLSDRQLLAPRAASGRRAAPIVRPKRGAASAGRLRPPRDSGPTGVDSMGHDKSRSVHGA